MQNIISTKIVWESESVPQLDGAEYHKMFIRDMGDEYRIDSPGTYALFDKTDQMLKGVIAAVEKYGCLISGQGNSPIFCCCHADGKETTLPLVQIIAGIHKDLPYTTFKGKRFRYHDNNRQNLHTNNIFCSGYAADVFDCFGKPYIIVVSSDNGKRRFAITNYSAELLRIINNRQWYYNAGTGELTTVKNVKLKHVVWAHFKKGANLDNMDSVLLKLREEFNPTNSSIPTRNMLVIDHKSAGQEKWDTRIENLQILTHSQNAQKNDCTSRLKGNAFYLPTYSGEVYGLYNEEAISYYRRLGDVNENELEKLKAFCRNGKLPKEHETRSYDMPEVLSILKDDLIRNYLYQYGEKAKRQVRLGNFFDSVQKEK